MSIESQKIIETIQYISFAGLIISGIAVFFIPDLKRKIILLFLLFVSTLMLSFVFYSGILIFIASLSFIFVFVLIHLLAVKLSPHGRGSPLPTHDAEGNCSRIITIRIINIIIPVLLCTGSGYLIYKLIGGGYFSVDDGAQEVSIIGMEEISGLIFVKYNIIIFLLVTAVLISFIWFTIILMIWRKDKGDYNK